jgi:hypothetical protein
MTRDLTRRRIVQEGTPIASPSHVFVLEADQVDTPSAPAWPVGNPAPAMADPSSARPAIVRAFAGVGFAYIFPQAPSEVLVEYRAKPSAKSPVPLEYDFDLYVRSLSGSLDQAKWVPCRAPEPFVIPPEKSEDFGIYVQGPFSLPQDLGPHIQFEISRRMLANERSRGDLLVTKFWLTFDP